MKKLVTLTMITCFLASYSNAQLPTYVPSGSLLSWIPFNGNMNDVSGHSNNATNANTTYTTDRFGSLNSAANFPGGNSYGEIPNLAFNTNGQYSINFWMKLNAYTVSSFDYIILDVHPGLTCSPYPQLNMYADSISYTQCGTWGYNRAFGHKSTFLNTWRMLTQVISGDTTKLYVDGMLVKKYYHAWGASTVANVVLGNNHNTDNTFNRGANMLFDDFGVWARELTDCEIMNLYYATTSYVSLQPVNQSVGVGGNAVFTVNSTIPGSITYQWQMNNGTGFVNLSNAGQFSGVNTNTLTVSNLTPGNNNQLFRCVVAVSAGCADTSGAAAIIIKPSGVYGQTKIAGSSLLQNTPNPGHKETVIGYYIANLQKGASLVVYDMQGRTVLVEPINKQGNGSLKISGLNAGIYFYGLDVDGRKADLKRMVILD